MAKNSLACLLFITGLTAACASAGNPRLRDELLAMSKTDQEARQALIAAGIERPDEKLMAAVERVDSINTKRMKQVVREFGWPPASLVGDDGAVAMFLLVQHADRDPGFQREALPLLRAAFARKEASGEHLALLTDRTLVAEGKPQRYGTQADIVDGKVVVKPVEDEPNLDLRRAELGLPSMDAYLELMRQVYGLPPQQR